MLSRLLKASKVYLALGMVSVSGAVLTLSGCAMGDAALPAESSSLTTMSGRAMGGQQPVANATTTIWKAGFTGYGQGATSLYTTSTDPGGNFNFTGKYSCASGDMLYITVYGGNPGAGINSALGLMAVVGECSTVLAAPPSIVINEATTVAGMTALQQFATVNYGTSGLSTLAASGTPLNIGTTATNKVGLANAFVTINNLAPATNSVNIPQSYSRTAMVGGSSTTVTVTPPYAKIATLANILASCVNTADGTSISSGCSSLFSAVKPATQSSAPADTIQAALDLAINPSNVGGTSTAPYSLSSTSAPFQPALSAPPNDWTLSLQFNNSSVVSPTTSPAIFLYESDGLQVDSSGNVYVLNYAGGGSNSTFPYNNSVAEFGPDGTPVSIYYNNGDFSYPSHLVLAPDNTVWVSTAGEIQRFTSPTNSVHTIPANAYSINTQALVSDSQGNVFGVGSDGNLYEATPTSGNYAGISSIGTLTTANSNYMAFDGNLNLWVTGSATTSSAANQYIDVFACSKSGGGPCTSTSTNTYATPTVFTAFPTVNSAKGYPAGIAFDHSNNAFITATTYYTPFTNTYGYGCEFALTLATEATSTTPSCSSNGLAGLNEPGQAAVDGTGNIWVTDYAVNTSFGYAASGLQYSAGSFTSISGLYGYPDSPVSNSLIQLDQAGNVWEAPYQQNGVGTITEIVGVVSPVTAPLSLALKNGTLGTKP